MLVLKILLQRAVPKLRAMIKNAFVRLQQSLSRAQTRGNRKYIGKLAAVSGTFASVYGFSSVCSIRAEGREDRPIVVVGGGIIGGSVAWALAGVGRHVIVLDAGYPGSSWGETRIARLAYEDIHFVRLMQRAFVLWEKLAKETGRTLLNRCPCLDVGDIDSASLKSLKTTYEALGLPYEELSAEQVPAHFPQVKLPPYERAVLQREAGVLLASECFEAVHEAAESRGAEWIYGETVTAIDRKGKMVQTDEGRRIHYSKLVLCGGPWTNKLLTLAGLPLMPIIVSNEQNLYYVNDDQYTGPSYDVDSGMPIVIEHFPPTGGAKDQGIYCIPHVGGIPGIKVGEHRVGTLLRNDEFIVREDSLQNLHLIPTRSKEFKDARCDEVDEGPKARCDEYVKQHFPGLRSSGSHHLRCLYSQTTLEDENFIVGQMPTDPDIFLACGFGGEGFKFSVAIGEFVCQLVMGSQLSVPDVFELFRVSRALLENV